MSSRSQDAIHRVASSDVSADERTLYDPDSEDEGYDGRPSGELLDGDHDILESEDERDRLLTQKDGLTGIFGKQGVKIGKLSRKAEMKERKKEQNEETSALMYEMEEGIGRSTTSLRSRRSSESDEQRLVALRLQRKACQISPCANVRLILNIGTENTSMASPMHLHIYSRALRYPSVRRVSPFHPKRRQRCGSHHVEWNVTLRPHNHSHVP
jgi:hypothetical protein